MVDKDNCPILGVWTSYCKQAVSTQNQAFAVSTISEIDNNGTVQLFRDTIKAIAKMVALYGFQP